MHRGRNVESFGWARNPCWRSKLYPCAFVSLCVLQHWLNFSYFALCSVTPIIHKQDIFTAVHNVHRRRLTRILGDGVCKITCKEVSVPNPFTHEQRRGTGLHETEANYLPKNTTSFYPRPPFHAPSSTQHPGSEVGSGFVHPASHH